MPHHLYLLRHAKSSWKSDAPTDFERPLAKRGTRDAPRMGRWLYGQRPRPMHVLSSPATRAKQTTKRVCKPLDIKKKDIHWDERIYAADVPELLTVLGDCPSSAASVLLVGHNPALEDLLSFLLGDETPMPEDGKLLPTAAVAHLELPDDWQRLECGSGRLVSLIRPGDLPAP